MAAADDGSDTSSTIVTISELIDNAFGDPEVNTVHHKHIQAVLYILARQLRILQRRVQVRLTPLQIQVQKSSSNLSVTEVKLHTMTETKKEDNKTSIVFKKGQKGHRGKQKLKGDKSNVGSPDKTTSTSDDTSAIKALSDKASSYKTSSYGASSDKASTIDKSSTAEKSTAGQTSTSDKTSNAGKPSTADDTSTHDLASTAGKTLNVGKHSATGETSAAEDISTSSVDKTSIANKKSAAGKTSATDDTSIAGIISTGDVTSKAGKKSTVGKTLAADYTSTADKTSGAGKKSTDGKTSTADNISGKLSMSRTSLEKNVSVDKFGKRVMAQVTKSLDSQDYQRLLDEVEESRERELRVIRQRADSREQRGKTPTPIASMDSFEATYEKLLVVERVPAEEAQARAARGRSTTRGESVPRLSVVTQEEFQSLASAVHQLKKKFAPIATPDFPENAQLMLELRKGASLTDAMAALQLSARLEATENTLTNLLSIVTDLASQTPGYKPSEGVGDDIDVLFGPDEKGQKRVKDKSKSAKSFKGHSQKESDTIEKDLAPIDSVEILVPITLTRSNANSPDDDVKKIDDIITFQELETALQNIYENIMKQVDDKSSQSAISAEKTLKAVNDLEKKIDVSLNLGNRMDLLENLVSNYSEQINALDTGLSSQLTYYQEELTQMQHDLETGLETMAEVLANTGGDVTAVAELNAHFNDLQVDIEDAMQKQKELRTIQAHLAIDLDALRAQIEMLRETKSDRDEVVDALRDKAGLGDLNGLISHQQFDTVRGDFEKRISNAYDKFNNQESVWQKAIDDLLRELNEKADIRQVLSLRDEINHYLEELRKKMKFITDIVGEPVAAALSRQLSRDAACLSCAASAHMKTEESTMPILPAMRPATIGAEAQKPTEDGDHGLCYLGYPVKHPIDSRAHACNRWCGGSHTLINAPKSRLPPSVTVTSLNRKVGQECGTDGKMYAVDELVPKKPCTQCTMPDPPVASKHEFGNTGEDSSNFMPFDFHPILSAAPGYDVTPPL